MTLHLLDCFTCQPIERARRCFIRILLDMWPCPLMCKRSIVGDIMVRIITSVDHDQRSVVDKEQLHAVKSEGTHRALQKYMHEFHADRDHAMCNIQNRSIPAVQLTQLRKLSNKNFQSTGVLKSSQSCQVLQCTVAARQWRCLAEIVSFSGSCSRCLVLSPLPCPTLPK
jgi:hypothetical protein